jgi:hypothetical protein
MLVIVAQQMQQTVQREHPRLDAESVPRTPGLTARHACRDHDVAEKPRLI